MRVTATLNNLRLAPRKVRAVVALLKKRGVEDALHQLEHLVRRPSDPLAKLMRSAIANAENNYHMVRSNLFVKEITVDEGVKLRRFLPRAQGRATEIQKKTSCIHLVLDEKVPGLKRQVSAQPEKATTSHTHEHGEEATSRRTTKGDKPEVKKEDGTKATGIQGLAKRMFRRKAI